MVGSANSCLVAAHLTENKGCFTHDTAAKYNAKLKNTGSVLDKAKCSRQNGSPIM